MKKKPFLFEYLKGKATDRKGVGMELALLVLLVVFACSTLLVSSTLMGKNNLKTQEQRLYQRIALDELAERIMENDTTVKTDEKFSDYAAFQNGSDVLNRGIEPPADEILADANLVITDLSGTPLLTVAWEDGKITRWSYN